MATPVHVTRPLHPRRGTHLPTAASPLRSAGSIRRTGTLDVLRPDGLLGRVVLDGHARDLLTDGSGAATVLGTARLSLDIDFIGGRIVTGISADPDEPRLQQLLGLRASSGFRGGVADAVPDQRDGATLVHMLLDDVPVATLVGGYAMQAGGVVPPAGEMVRRATPDLCSGWVSGGTIMADVDSRGVVPVVTGPDAPSLLLAGDPLAWHERPTLPADTVRRSRRLDVRLVDGFVLLDSLFRDSHVATGGRETVVHEYAVRAVVDPR